MLLYVTAGARDCERDISVPWFVNIQQIGWEFSREQCRAGQLGEQASGQRVVVELTVGMFFATQDIRRHPSPGMASQPVVPLPTPEPMVQRAGDVEIGGFHLIEMHWATVFSGGGLVLLIIGVICVTYCCIKGHLQICCLNSCRLCCPSDLGGDQEAQGRQGQGAQTPAGTLVSSSGSQMLTTVQATAPAATPTAHPAIGMEGAGGMEGLGYSRTLEDILAARRARKGGCGGCYGGHTQGACVTGQTMM